MDDITRVASPITSTVPPREKLSEKLLNAKVMEMLLARASCSDARSVMLELVQAGQDGPNWQIGHFDPGHGDRYACKLALRRIHEALRGTYDMVGQS